MKTGIDDEVDDLDVLFYQTRASVSMENKGGVEYEVHVVDKKVVDDDRRRKSGEVELHLIVELVLRMFLKLLDKLRFNLSKLLSLDMKFPSCSRWESIHLTVNMVCFLLLFLCWLILFNC